MSVLKVSILALREWGKSWVLLQDGGVPARSRCTQKHFTRTARSQRLARSQNHPVICLF